MIFLCFNFHENIMTKNEFIETSLIAEIGRIKDVYPYWAFLLMSVGIEFLGRILNKRSDEDNGSSKYDFCYAIHNIDALKEYREYTSTPHINSNGKLSYDFPSKILLKSDPKKDFYAQLRCAFAHNLQMGRGIVLDNSCEKHLLENSVRLGVHAFYDDFKKACEEILSLLNSEEHLSSEKMNFFDVKSIGNISLSGHF